MIDISPYVVTAHQLAEEARLEQERTSAAAARTALISKAIRDMSRPGLAALKREINAQLIESVYPFQKRTFAWVDYEPGGPLCDYVDVVESLLVSSGWRRVTKTGVTRFVKYVQKYLH